MNIRGLSAFSVAQEVSTAGGTAFVQLWDGGGPPTARGRLIIDELDVNNVGAGILTIFVADRWLNTQVFRKFAAGERWTARQIEWGSAHTDGITVWASLTAGATTTAMVHIAGRRQ